MFNSKYLNAKRNKLLDDGDSLVLKGLIDDNPNLYLDKIVVLFGIKTRKFVHYSTMKRYMLYKLNYSMKVIQSLAAQ